jgi:hypothetical protein
LNIGAGALSSDQSLVVEVMTDRLTRCDEQFLAAATGGALAYPSVQFAATTAKFTAQLKSEVTTDATTKLKAAPFGAAELKTFGVMQFKALYSRSDQPISAIEAACTK